MPKKPNRAAQLQNYVPAGNGDASGEYADEETGSNIHFTNFKKPEDDFNQEEFDKGLQDGLEEIEEEFDEGSLMKDLEEIKEEESQPSEPEQVIEDLDEKKTKQGILNLDSGLDKDKVMALSKEEAKKLLKAINATKDEQKKKDKLQAEFSKQEFVGIWKDPQTIASLIEKFGSADAVMQSLEVKRAWAETNKPELVTAIDGLDKEALKEQLNAYLSKKQKLDAKIEKAKNLLKK